MIIIPHEDLIAVDIDDTLVMMVDPYSKIEESNGVLLVDYDISIDDPYGILGIIYLKEHKPNINMVQRGFKRGFKHFAWSRAGYKWAQAVVEALDMEECFEFCMTKPIHYIDDLPCNEWMNHRSYLPHDKIGWNV